MRNTTDDQTPHFYINERGFLKKALHLVRSGQSPRIGLPDGYEFTSKSINNLADVAVLAMRQQMKPSLYGVTERHGLNLEVRGLLEAFNTVALPCPAPPEITLTKSRSLSHIVPQVSLFLVLVLAMIALAGCAGRRSSNDFVDTHFTVEPVADVPIQRAVPARVGNSCKVATGSGTYAGTEIVGLQQGIHGPGDVVQIDITDGEDFSGKYVVNFDGNITLPHAGPVKASGRTDRELSLAVKNTLTKSGLFQESQVQVAVLSMRWAPMNILVSGAVYQPGRTIINDPALEKRDLDALTTIGDAPMSRYIDAGLRAGAGIRPDADLAHIKLIRNNQSHDIDLSGLVTGQAAPDVPLMAGDRLVVPSSGCFHVELMRPSQATPPGMRIFMSNLTVPATGNNPSAIDNYASNLPYGSRLLQGVTSANCIGGARTSNANRYVVLMSNNPLTGRTEIIERSIEDLLHHANEQAANPYLLPNDALACYDSGVTDIREVARTMTEIFGPLGYILGAL
jgi:polysaccharide biosynthesis/export protein